MKVEHGERGEGETVVSFQRERGKREKEREHKEWNPLFHLTGRNENLCRYQGGCFYSGVSIATVSMCPFYRPAELLLCNVWKKHTQMPETIWLLVIRQRQTSFFNTSHTAGIQYRLTHTHTGAWDKFKMTWHVLYLGNKGFTGSRKIWYSDYDFYNFVTLSFSVSLYVS